MLIQIVQNTPKWVFALFAALLWLGLSQTVTRRVTLRRVAMQGLGLTGFSLYGMLSAFPDQPLALLTWLAGGFSAFAAVMLCPAPAGTHYDRTSGRFTLPGSALPLALIMGLFLIKYAVGATLAMQHALAQNLLFALGCGSVYGVFAGVFAARACRLWRFARVRDNAANARLTPQAHTCAF